MLLENKTLCLNGWFIKRKSIGKCEISKLDHGNMVNVCFEKSTKNLI